MEIRFEIVVNGKPVLSRIVEVTPDFFGRSAEVTFHEPIGPNKTQKLRASDTVTFSMPLRLTGEQ